MVSQPKHITSSTDIPKFTSAEQLGFLPELLETSTSDDLKLTGANSAAGTNLGLKTPAYLTEGSRDEMNLAEFPLAVLSSRSNPNIKTLEFSDTQRLKTGEIIERKWTITGADKFGLPTSTDDDVVLGLMQLTKDQGFRNRKVYFTRYELLKALRWSTEGRSYGRLTKSLDRLSGVRIRAANAFYDNSAKAYQTVNFGLIDAYEINDSRGGADHEQPKSFFIWSEKLFDSFKSGFIKKLDLELYFSLRSAVSRRMYRYLDKHTYYRSTIDRHLMSFAFDKLGLSRTYKFVSSIKQQIEPACQELQAVGFLSGYEFVGSGKESFIRFTVARSDLGRTTGTLPLAKDPVRENTSPERSSPNELPVPNSSDPRLLHDALMARGMTSGQVGRLLRDKSGAELDRIKLIIEHFDNSTPSSGQGGGARNPIGLLYRAVEAPFSFVLPHEVKGEWKVANPSMRASVASGRTDDGQQRVSSANSGSKRSLRPELKVVTAATFGQDKHETEKSKDRNDGSRQRDSFKTYERFLELEIAKVKADMCIEELTALYSRVQQKMSCLSAVLSVESLRESTERCFDEEIRKLANIPDFRSWLKGAVG